MSKIFDKSGSFSERSALATVASLTLAFGWYGVTTAANAHGQSFRAVGYKGVMVVSVGVFALLMAVSHAALAVMGPRDAGEFDERDRQIERTASRWGGYVLATGVFGALVLVLTDSSRFSIAQALLGSWVLSELASNAISIVHHRRTR